MDLCLVFGFVFYGDLTMTVKVDKELCTGCGLCVDSCPSEALKMNEAEEKVEVIAEACVDCGVCVDECPSEALEME